MKNSIIIFLFACISPMFFFSCNDFLEKPPSIDITIDTVFSDTINAKRMLSTLYSGVPYHLVRAAGTQFEAQYRGMLAGATDEGDGGASWSHSHLYNTGALNATNITNSHNNYYSNYKLIRAAWVFAEQIENVKQATPAQKKIFKAEAKMIIAMQYYEMMIRMGSVPFLDHALTIDEDWKITRLPLVDFASKVDALIDEALVDLPDRRASIEEGRLTKSFGYFLKARLKLALARPLFNHNEPYLQMDNAPNNNLIWLGGYDRNRYKEALDACQAAINYLESQGHRLLELSDLPNADVKTKQDAYAMACKTPPSVNPEMVYYTIRAKNISSKWTNWVHDYGPRVEGGGHCQPTENFKRVYQLSNGKSQTVDNGYDPNNPYVGLDPRFYATYIYHGALFGSNYYSMVLGDNRVDAEKFDPEAKRPWLVGRASTERCRTGYHLRKLVQEDVYGTNPRAVTPISPYMRMAEIYLMYAEALNEYYQGPNADCYFYLNKVRTRCGMPEAENLDYEGMKAMIEYERAIELAFESQRYFDMRQWRKAEVFGESIVSFDIKRDNNDKSKLTYSNSILEGRVWETKRYLDPFPLNEINMNYGLVQNPGW